MSRTTNDIDNVVTTLNSSGADTIYSIFQLVGMIVMMTAINWRLALITVIIIPVSGWIVTLISRFVRKEYQKQWYYTGMINSNVEESVNGHNIVKLYGQEEKFVEAFRKQNRLLYESSLQSYGRIELDSAIVPVLYESELCDCGIGRCFTGNIRTDDGRRCAGIYSVYQTVSDTLFQAVPGVFFTAVRNSVS